MTDNTYAEASARLKAYEQEGLVLGDLCWYSIPEGQVDHAEVVRAMHATGIDQLFLPPPPRSGDVFKRACTSSQRKRVYGSPLATNTLIKHNYMIREVGKDREKIWRHLVREDVDSEGHKLGYVPLAEIEFDRATSVIRITRENTHDTTADVILSEVQDRFKQWNNSLTAYSLRELVRRILEILHATVVRPSGGVYFVRAEKHEPITALELTINSLPNGCSFHALPLLDDQKQREMLKKAFEDESIDEVDKRLGEIAEIRRSNGQITSDKYGQYGADYKRLTAKVAEYSDLLDTALATTASRLEIYQEAIIGLMDNVKA